MIWARATTVCARVAGQHARVQDIYLRILHDTCRLLGGEHKLAQRLGVDVQQISSWLNGDGRPPDAVFLRCLDLILEPG